MENKQKSYPQGYSTEELEMEIDKYGNESPNSHLGSSYYARASLGLTELERRSTAKLGWWTLLISILALIFSILAVLYTAEQTRLTEIQSRSERINQNRATTEAKKRCEEFPELQDSGLRDIETGESAPCSEVLKIYKN